MNMTTKTIMSSVAKTALLLVVVVGTLALTTGCEDDLFYRFGRWDNVWQPLIWYAH